MGPHFGWGTSFVWVVGEPADNPWLGARVHQVTHALQEPQRCDQVELLSKKSTQRNPPTTTDQTLSPPFSPPLPPPTHTVRPVTWVEPEFVRQEKRRKIFQNNLLPIIFMVKKNPKPKQDQK